MGAALTCSFSDDFLINFQYPSAVLFERQIFYQSPRAAGQFSALVLMAQSANLFRQEVRIAGVIDYPFSQTVICQKLADTVIPSRDRRKAARQSL